MMPYHRVHHVCADLILALLTICLVTISHTPAQAETYVAGQVGLTIPNSLRNLEADGGSSIPSGTTISNLDLKNSIMYGAKLGHYFNAVRWLGVEIEAFNTHPHIRQQPASITLPQGFFFANTGSRSTTVDLPGSTGSVTTLAFNVVARVPGERLQPYAAAGLGLFFTHDENQSAPSPGLNTQVGLRYKLTHRFAVFGEWKYNYVTLNYEETATLPGFDTTYSAHHFVFGVGYHFN